MAGKIFKLQKQKSADIEASPKTKETEQKRSGLQFEYPFDGLAVSDDVLEVKVLLLPDSGLSDKEDVGPGAVVEIAVDGKVAACAKPEPGAGIVFAGKVDISKVVEGPHTLQAKLAAANSAKSSAPIQSSTINFIIDRTPPGVRSMFPGQFIEPGDLDSSHIALEVEDAHSGINLGKCAAVIDGKINLKPTGRARGLVFPLRISPKKKIYNIKVVLVDKAGNKSEHESEFRIGKFSRYVSSLMIDAHDIATGIDVESCAATLDGEPLKTPYLSGRGVVFPVCKELKRGSHKLKSVLSDNAGNKTVFESTISIKNAGSLTTDLIIHAEDSVSGLDLTKCSLSIDGRKQHKPSGMRKCVIFPLGMKFRDFDEGSHYIKIDICDMADNAACLETEFIIDPAARSKYVDLFPGPAVVIDEAAQAKAKDIVKEDKPVAAQKTHRLIGSIFPYDGMRIMSKDLSCVIVGAEIKTSKLDIKSCRIVLDGDDVLCSKVDGDSLVFLLDRKIGKGKREVDIQFVDIDGNIEKESALFTVIEGTKEDAASSEADEQLNKERATDIMEKLATNNQLLAGWLSNSSGVLRELGLFYTAEIARFLPPSLSEEQAGVLSCADIDEASETIKSLMERVSTAVESQMPEVLKPIEKTGVVDENGNITVGAKELMQAILQDPADVIESFGVDLSEDEQSALFPPFSKKQAEDLMEWIVMMKES